MGIMSTSTLHTQLNAPLVGTGAAWMPGGGARAVLVPYMTTVGIRTIKMSGHLLRPGS